MILWPDLEEPQRASGDDQAGAALLELVVKLAGRLRRNGVVVSTGQLSDAARALAIVDPTDPAQLRIALQATLIKHEEHLPLFEAALWATLVPPPPAGEDTAAPADVRAALADALRRGDDAAVMALAGHAVDAYAGIDPEQFSAVQYHLRRTMRQLHLSELLMRAIRLAEENGDDDVSVAALRSRLDALEALVQQEVEERLAEVGGDDAPPDGTDLAEVDFLQASPGELARLREAVAPLARRLAVRLARRRSHRTASRVDMRRTLRRSLATGGVPADLCFRREHLIKPDVVVLADISGSVAEFARFFLMFLHAVHQELPRVRSFCFVDDVDEVTHLVDTSPGALEVRHLLQTTRVVGKSGHSDYGTVFSRFSDQFGSALGPRTTLLIAGDGRTNDRDPNVEGLEAINRCVRRTYWLNPEPRPLWDTRDSVIGRYSRACASVVEVRNANQLVDFVASLA